MARAYHGRALVDPHPRRKSIAVGSKEIEVAQASGAALRQRAEPEAVFDENFETLARERRIAGMIGIAGER